MDEERAVSNATPACSAGRERSGARRIGRAQPTRRSVVALP